MKNDNNRVIEIEDYQGNTEIAFIVVEGEIAKTKNCDVADVTVDYIFGTQFPLIKIRSGAKETKSETQAPGKSKYRLLRLAQRTRELNEQGHIVEYATTEVKIALEDGKTKKDVSDELYNELYQKFGQKTSNEEFVVEVVPEWVKK